MNEKAEYRTNDLPLSVEAGDGRVIFRLGEESSYGAGPEYWFWLESEEAIELAHQILRNHWTP